MAAEEPQLTTSEKARVAWHIARGAKRSLAGPDVTLTDIEKAIDRIKAGAAKRAEREAKKK